MIAAVNELDSVAFGNNLTELANAHRESVGWPTSHVEFCIDMTVPENVDISDPNVAEACVHLVNAC